MYCKRCGALEPESHPNNARLPSKTAHISSSVAANLAFLAMMDKYSVERWVCNVGGSRRAQLITAPGDNTLKFCDAVRILLIVLMAEALQDGYKVALGYPIGFGPKEQLVDLPTNTVPCSLIRSTAKQHHAQQQPYLDKVGP